MGKDKIEDSRFDPIKNYFDAGKTTPESISCDLGTKPLKYKDFEGENFEFFLIGDDLIRAEVKILPSGLKQFIINAEV